MRNVASFLCFCAVVYTCLAQTYYVDPNASPGGDGTSMELTGPHAAWRGPKNISGLAPGDSVLFRRGSSWPDALFISVSGEPNAYIRYDAYGSGSDPLIDVSQDSNSSPAVWMYGVDYVEVRNFRLKGSGGTAAMLIMDSSVKFGSGAMGQGYTITVRDVNVLSNYGASDGGHDGFALNGRHPYGSSQVLFYNIAATKCRDDPDSGGSHQCLTAHQQCKAKVYGARFSDSVNWYAGTQGSRVEFYDIFATSCTAFGIAMVGDDVNHFCLISNSTLISDVPGGKLFGVSDDASKDGPRLVIQDSFLKSYGSSPCFNSGNIVLENNKIIVDDPGWMFDQRAGSLVMRHNEVIYGETRNDHGFIKVTDTGHVDIEGNLFLVREPIAPVFYFAGGVEPNTRSVVKNNIFRHLTTDIGVIRIADDICGPMVYNNTFYNLSPSGLAVRLQHDGDEAKPVLLDLQNNIFYNIIDVLDCPAEAKYIAAYNCFYCSEHLGGLGSIDAEPCFVNPDSNDFHLKSEGWRWSQDYSRWTWDGVTSRCIDAGNAGFSLAEELPAVPEDPLNLWGRNIRINMGAYGGTAEASIGPHGHALLSDVDNSGTVNEDDLWEINQYWLCCEPNLPVDLDRSGVVDLLDFSMLGCDWKQKTTWYHTPLVGDLNSDGRVNIIDFSVMSCFWQVDNCGSINLWCEGADIDSGGAVNVGDLLLLTQNWLAGALEE
jgi:hypothetical protein